MKLKCPFCNIDGPMGYGSNFDPRGRFDGYAIYQCGNCGAGLRIKNAGRAMLTKRAKAAVIPADQWARMSAQWDSNFPT